MFEEDIAAQRLLSVLLPPIRFRFKEVDDRVVSRPSVRPRRSAGFLRLAGGCADAVPPARLAPRSLPRRRVTRLNPRARRCADLTKSQGEEGVSTWDLDCPEAQWIGRRILELECLGKIISYILNLGNLGNFRHFFKTAQLFHE